MYRIVCLFYFVCRGTIHVKSLKSSSGIFSEQETLSFEDVNNLRVSNNNYFQVVVRVTVVYYECWLLALLTKVNLRVHADPCIGT